MLLMIICSKPVLDIFCRPLLELKRLIRIRSITKIQNGSNLWWSPTATVLYNRGTRGYAATQVQSVIGLRQEGHSRLKAV